MGLARLGSVAAPLAIACVAASMAPAHAQTAPPGAAAALSSATREADRVQREQEERRQDQVRRDLERAQPRTSLSVPAPPGPKNAPGPCREITEITLKGAARLGGGQRAALVKPYAGRCLTAQDIAGLMGDVTKVYIDIGYATARVYLPPQDLRTGKLELLVVEGALSAVAPKRGRKSGVFVGGAFPGLKGRPLNLRDLEQGLDQLNRLESNHATMDIRPGERPGESLVVIANEPARRLHGLFAVDDEGSQSTGQSQMALTAVMDDLLGLNELISVTRRQSEPLNSPHAGISSSENYLASVPWGRWLVSAGYSESRYKSFITTPPAPTWCCGATAPPASAVSTA